MSNRLDDRRPPFDLRISAGNPSPAPQPSRPARFPDSDPWCIGHACPEFDGRCIHTWRALAAELAADIQRLTRRNLVKAAIIKRLRAERDPAHTDPQGTT